MTAVPFVSATIPANRLLPGIHGLRGMAAVAVVLFHLVHLAEIRVPEFFAFIAADFGKGVQLFFVLSAFSLMHSTEHTMHRPTWAKEYFVKRLFRIAPLFYCILGGMILWPALKSGYMTFSWEAVLLNFSFVFGLAPWTGIVWAGWTVGVEMLFYALLPVLLLTVRSRLGALYLALICIAISYVSRSILHAHYEHTTALYHYNWSEFSLLPNLCHFAFGIYAFRIAAEIDCQSTAFRAGVAWFAVLLVGTLLLAGNYFHFRGDKIIWGIGFAALALWQCKWPARWSANRVCEYLGERSYSLYLLHPVVIILLKPVLQETYNQTSPWLGSYAYFVCATLLLLLLLVAAEASYRLIELPGIRFGQRIISKIRQS
jgi:peptidoglycan/LPS O-acetylase OafA/YrhL